MCLLIVHYIATSMWLPEYYTYMWELHWLAVCVGWGWGPVSGQASQVLLGETISLWNCLCSLMHHHVETGKDHPQTVDTLLCKYRAMLWPKYFLWVELRSPKPWKQTPEQKHKNAYLWPYVVFACLGSTACLWLSGMNGNLRRENVQHGMLHTMLCPS